MALVQLIYVSALAPLQDATCLKDILRESQSNNPSKHVTGILLYVNGSFLQVLEGETDEVEALYEKIEHDPRHTATALISRTNIEERQFGRWSMGHADVNAGELDEASGLNDFFSGGKCLTQLDTGLTLRVLKEFRSGLWRRRIHN